MEVNRTDEVKVVGPGSSQCKITLCLNPTKVTETFLKGTLKKLVCGVEKMRQARHRYVVVVFFLWCLIVAGLTLVLWSNSLLHKHLFLGAV